MITDNAQSQAPRTWTNQEECRLSNDGGCDRGTGQNSRTLSSESLSPNRDDWAGADSFDSTGGIPFGGTIQQLIAETRDEIVELANRSEKLQKRLTELEQLCNQLYEQSGIE